MTRGISSWLRLSPTPNCSSRSFSFTSNQFASVETIEQFNGDKSDASSSSSQQGTEALPPLSPPAVANWLLVSASLVFGIVVVGGLTRLTESGLSITEWKPVTGFIPPFSEKEWEEEFDKYKATPEFKILNHRITLSEFKSIFFMEYGHRVLGRLVGLVFVAPYTYFLLRRRLTPTQPTRLGLLALLLGFQGFLGWYMVKSGLEEENFKKVGSVPRVSQYRLAAHLGAALALYAGMLGMGLSVGRDWKYAMGSAAEVMRTNIVPSVKRFRIGAWGLMGLVFVTALSGAFVAGLDAGLVYNEFPYMGGRLAPPLDELFSPDYAQLPDGSDTWWRNLLENPTTTQFDHRVLAMTTYLSTTALFLTTRLPSVKPFLPALTHRIALASLGLVNLQAALGISTLLYLVPIPLAAAHQAGSVALLSAIVGLVVSLRAPGRVARMWREAGMMRKRSNPR